MTTMLMGQAECSFGHVMVYVNNIVVREEMLDVGVSEIAVSLPDRQGSGRFNMFELTCSMHGRRHQGNMVLIEGSFMCQ